MMGFPKADRAIRTPRGVQITVDNDVVRIGSRVSIMCKDNKDALELAKDLTNEKKRNKIPA